MSHFGISVQLKKPILKSFTHQKLTEHLLEGRKWDGILFTQEWRGPEWVYWSSLDDQVYYGNDPKQGERLGDGPKVELPGLFPSA